MPAALHALETDDFLARLDELDTDLASRYAAAASRGCVLRFLARLNQHCQAHVGLTEVPLTHPAARLYGSDNLFALTTIPTAASRW